MTIPKIVQVLFTGRQERSLQESFERNDEANPSYSEFFMMTLRKTRVRIMIMQGTYAGR